MYLYIYIKPITCINNPNYIFRTPPLEYYPLFNALLSYYLGLSDDWVGGVTVTLNCGLPLLF